MMYFATKYTPTPCPILTIIIEASPQAVLPNPMTVDISKMVILLLLVHCLLLLPSDI